jgi:hypothetical protein
MDVHCGIEYHIGTPSPPRARFALRYGKYVRYFKSRENAEEALKLLPFEDQRHAGISRLLEEDEGDPPRE